jgi:hypothetical protein
MAATDVVVVIDGKTITPFARIGRVRIDDLLNDAPNTAAVTIVATPRTAPVGSGGFDPGGFDAGGFATARTGGATSGAFNAAAFNPGAFASATLPPAMITPPPILPGAPIAIYLGAIDPALQIFGGQVMNREQYAELEIPAHVRYDLSCLDFTRRLNHRTVTTEYATASVTAIVQDVIARFAPVITTTHVQAGLPSIPGMTFTFEDVSGALSRLAKTIGASWYVDYVGDLHFFIGTEAGAAPAPIVPGGRFADLKISADLTQVRTRIIVEAAGATSAATVPTADTLIPLSTALPFPSSGRAKIGTTIVAYSGTNPGGVKANTTGPLPAGIPPVDPIPPPAAPGAPGVALAPASTAGQAVGPYTYAVTLELADGRRSDVGASSAPVTITPAAAPPATSAALLATPARGPIVVGVASSYATSFVDAAGRQTPATTGGPTITGRAVVAPSGNIPYQVQANGRMKTGSYYYAVSFLTAHGETLTIQSAPAVPITADNQKVLLLAIPTALDGRVVGRRVYRSSANPDLSGQAAVMVPWHRVIDIPNNTATQYLDDAADTELSTTTLPVFTTANDVGEAATVTIPTSTDPRVVGRRLYRQDGAGGFRLVADLKDNTTTTFADVAVASGGDLAPTVNAITTGAILISGIDLGPAGTVRRRVFRTVAGGSQYRELVAINDNTTTTYTDANGDTALGGAPLPPVGIAGSPASAGAGIAPTPAGATTIELDTLAAIPAAGWILVEQQVIRYRGTTTIDGRFYLTGIPATGAGAITADILAGTVIATIPALTGVDPARPVTIGDDVNLIVIVDDIPAQTALAAVEGGDGIVEHYIQDRRLSDAGARARALAELALFKTIETRITYTTHDLETRSGRTVHVALPAPTNLSGDFLIQRVTFDNVGTAIGTAPRRQVDASTTRFSFDDVLARLLLEQT